MLDATPKQLVKRKALRINPAKTCQPVGAMYAALGIHNCLPHSHGSQGCCSYHRTVLSRHFKEPALASSSSFTEGACVFGGGSNVKTAVKNIFAMYNPDIIAIHTTCLSETIGDDLPTYIRDMEIPEGKLVIHTNTPSYVGSHVTGFSNMVRSMVQYLSVNSGKKNGKFNIIPGFVGPADMKEMKRIFRLMDIPYIIFPDTNGVLDAPNTGDYKVFPEGGTRVKDIIDAGNSDMTIAFGSYSSEDAAKKLETKCKVPFKTLEVPIGIDAMDDLIMTLAKITGKPVSEEIEEERGQLLDLILDCAQYFNGKKAAVVGDPDVVIPLVQFLITLGMTPKYVITGTPGALFEKKIKAIMDEAGIEGIVKANSDFFEMHQLIKNEGVDLLISNTYGKFIARAEDIPFVRFGFPVMDRYGHQYTPKVGYSGAIDLVRRMCDAMLDKDDRECKEEDFEVVR
ncbi:MULTISPECIES: nitrogenase component 1 [Clostridium]|jgi:nitrogenase molybdenum-iron protein beta chain|uniref:Nitrogenase molybdenum-iron protein beta chain n=1 Tax=Clostridium luticellarii TaxID=1691940 RepID=A0A2T0BIE3_9CLOT|nr:nitrogenase component 1 [Clostridium luticellarii]MCI1943963.1 nitrogenase molybdenum-iron protein subunit beta [Clostridium luticellarii]MCI1967224.1 nitrogenase molybdenum-iron protein subunit beta [Clostridium luticellarii]MCI1995955.1 nitrogenase molybdenum-iron protein subunit beta [Clostridium luticellarii]MCI2038456.1 nitrogenase molybdenum-iron protein subunit beta [Clostridium luticellarii]PRR83658.1 Nitrogenase molybdenum-iron protein beta chain [Clostridium luticellarii]